MVGQEKSNRVLLSGNEAIARGAIEGGVGFVASYPGTPSTGITMNLIAVADELGMHVEWSTNEKVALEAAVGASWMGVPALCSMKSLGLNVAADFLLNVNLSGTGSGGIVLVVCDDPRGYSSSNEQDSRFYAKAAMIPLLEPSSPQEAKNLTKYALSLSSETELPVMIRSTTRLSHSRGVVVTDDLPERQWTPSERIPEGLYNVPNPHLKHRDLLAKLERIRLSFDEGRLNTLKPSKRQKATAISSGVGHLYALETVERAGLGNHLGLLHLTTTHPLPTTLVSDVLRQSDSVLIIEEGGTFVEDEVRVLATTLEGELGTIYGKRTGHIPDYGEMTPDLVTDAINDVLGVADQREEGPSPDLLTEIDSLLVPRPLTFCVGCTHRNVYWALTRIRKRLNGNLIVAGDIGCYSLGVFYHHIMNTMQAMGSGIGTANGIAQLGQFGLNSKIIAIAGDSTFYHACLPGLINAKHKNLDLTFLILDNGTTAMTGFQPHPGSGTQAEGDVRLEIADVVRGIGPDHFLLGDAQDVGETVELLWDAVNRPGLKVVLLRGICQLESRKSAEDTTEKRVIVNGEECHGSDCRICVGEFGCFALAWDEKQGVAVVNDDICVRCGACIEVCPHGAIKREE
ncbi:indolepyruvate ferredoxin oxidoreductase [Candidatus Thorarchaeota archaeon]|nr:MAG: indolepyruvate ferredoxin oxidoreductase [Candidatus Thorarchaeota archaeon]